MAVVVFGRVQGVGFRYYARDIALSLGLTGWVCNLADGTVELEAQGESENLDLFREWLKKGPPLSHVSKMSLSGLPAVLNEQGFAIKH